MGLSPHVMVGSPHPLPASADPGDFQREQLSSSQITQARINIC